MRPPKSRQVHPTPVQGGRLDPKIWRACAGGSFRIPPLHSRVYYFPQGHIEHASSAPQYLNPLVFYRPFIPCRVSAVEFLADPSTDEVFAKISLLPLSDGNSDHYADSLEAPDDDKIVSFAKVLTPSDANNGGGFSVPRYCADSIFPPLNFQVDRPTQTLYVTDVHGNVWDFRHIYRGTPRRHLLTTGWSKFVNNKKLVAGDSVVFMKNSRGTMFVGIRRALRFAKLTTVDCSSWPSQLGGVRNKPEGEQQQVGYLGSKGKEGFSRNGKGKLSAKEVADNAELAAQNMPFEVVYYPRVGWSDFVVKAEVVEKAWNVAWTSGIRVKMAMETEDSSRITWFQGTVSSASAPDNGLWRGSPWRMLQVMWDEPEVLQNAKRVSPWEVELVSSAFPPNAVFPPAKRFRAAQYCGVATDREGDPFFMTGLTNSTMGHLNQSLLSYNTVPAGMQGARQDLSSVSSLSNFEIGNSHLYIGNTFGNMVPKMKPFMSTEPNIDSSQSYSLSPESQSSLHGSGTEFAGTRNCNFAKQGASSIQLFGKLIQLEQPVESGSHAFGCTVDEGSNGCNETEGVDQPLDHSLTNKCSLGLMSNTNEHSRQ
ncbi:auxin response factor 17-like [Prosopis cineraria]|uniref:auxin response factor 17-like n=1 Tax=Prosopis cineraria TaxID=364024 RepID=UPI00240F9FDA|nr:auxin response factor 17-like [Prosopis cineraria]